MRKPRFAMVYLLFAGLLLVARTTEPGLRWGIFIALLGEAIRCWANGYVGHVKVNWSPAVGGQKIGRLITAGPYAFVRHPLYLGTFLIGAGFCTMVGRLWFSLAALGLFLVIYQRKMEEEEDRLLHAWTDTYQAYHERVPRWLPNLRRYPDRQGQWSWQGIRASKEWKTCIWLIAVFIIVYFREEAFQEHHLFERQHGEFTKHVVLLILLGVLMAADGLMELLKRRAKRLASANPSNPA